MMCKRSHNPILHLPKRKTTLHLSQKVRFLTTKKEQLLRATLSRFNLQNKVEGLLLTVNFVRYSELLAALSATRSQNTTTVCSRHTLAETMLVVSLAIVGLERSFHRYLSYNLFFVYYNDGQRYEIFFAYLPFLESLIYKMHG